MGGIEALLIFIGILFFLVRAAIRGLRRLLRAGRPALAPPAAAAAEQTRARMQSDPRQPESRPEQRSAPQARITPRAADLRPPTSQTGQTTPNITEDPFGVRADQTTLVRALIWQEILAPPLSRRPRRRPPV